MTPLLASSTAPLRSAVEAAIAWITGGADGGAHSAEPGPTSDDADELMARRPVRGLLRRPPVLLIAGLGLLAATACRGLVGSGGLSGGALLPASSGAGDLWAAYTASWHGVGLGSDRAAPPYLAALAGLAALLFGKAGLAVDVLLLGCVPLAGLTAYIALGAAVRSTVLRLWGAAAYATLPVATGAVAGGHLGTATAFVLLPVLGRAAGRMLAVQRPPWSRAWLCGFLLALVTAFAPLTYALAAPLGLLAALTVGRRLGTALRILVILAVPPLLMLPWTLFVWNEPALLVREPGLAGPGLTEADVHPLAVLLLHPGGPGMYHAWFSAGLLVAAVAALLRPDRRRLLGAAWVTALAALLVAVALSRLDLPAPSATSATPVWPGFATGVAGAGLVLAAVVGAEGLAQRMSSWRFGLWQPIALLVGTAAAIVPALAASAWVVRGAGGPVGRDEPALLPAYVAAEAATPERPRTLVLSRQGRSRLGYAVVRGSGAHLGDADVARATDDGRLLDGVVAGLVSGRGGNEVTQLAGFAVRFVYAPRPAAPGLVSQLDNVPGLTRVGAPDGAALWRLDRSVSWLQIRPPDTPGVPVDAGGMAGQAIVPTGEPGRLLALAERAAPGWVAMLDGRRLSPTTAYGWAQGFVLPSSGGQLVLDHDRGDRRRWLLVQGGLLVIVLVLAVPSARASAVRVRRVSAARPSGRPPDRWLGQASGRQPPNQVGTRVGSSR